MGERREAAEQTITFGLELFGPPSIWGGEGLGPIEVRREDIRLIAYEALVPQNAPEAPALPIAGRLFLEEGDTPASEP